MARPGWVNTLVIWVHARFGPRSNLAVRPLCWLFGHEYATNWPHSFKPCVYCYKEVLNG